METSLIVIDSDAELPRAQELVDRLMTSDKPADLARLAGCRVVEENGGKAPG